MELTPEQRKYIVGRFKALDDMAFRSYTATNCYAGSYAAIELTSVLRRLLGEELTAELVEESKETR